MINKVDNYTFDDIVEYERLGNKLESISNAHYYQLARINNRNNDIGKFNPFTIKFDEMISIFGTYNFINYNEHPWWILKFNNMAFIIETNEREGSDILKFMEQSSDNIYDRKMSSDFTDFTNELVKQLKR